MVHFDGSGYDLTKLNSGPDIWKMTLREADVDRYDREDPIVGIKQLTSGFSKWAPLSTEFNM